LADTRADLLSSLFPALSVTRFDAAQIHDHLDAAGPLRRLDEPAFFGNGECHRQSSGRSLPAHRLGALRA
jgi:hypothetical protein